MKKQCPYCGKGVNINSTVSRVEHGKDTFHFACYQMADVGFKTFDGKVILFTAKPQEAKI